MKNTYLRLTAVLLSFSIALTVLGGCKSKKEDEESLLLNNSMNVSKDPNLNLNGLPIVKEKISLTGAGLMGSNQLAWNSMTVFNEYEKMTNIDINWKSFPQDKYHDSVKLMIESGDLPDMFMSSQFTPGLEASFGSNGTIIPLNDLIKKHAPAFMSITAKNHEVIKAITNTDGKIYSLPQLNDVLENRLYKTWINKKWLDNLGLKVPTTTDEFYNTLKAFKEKDPNKNGLPDELPFTGAYIGGWSDDLIIYFMGYWGFNDTFIVRYVDVDKNGKIRFIADDPKYKEVLMYLNRLYSEGLIDKDFFNTNLNQFQKKVESDTVGYTPGYNTYDWIGKNKDDFTSQPVLKGPYGDHVLSRTFSFIQATGTFAISGKNKYPEATMRWADYLYTTEGTTLFRMGVEGKTYKRLPDGSMEYVDSIAKAPGVNGVTQAISKHTPGFGSMIPLYVTKESSRTIPPIHTEHTKVLIPDMPKEYVIPLYTTEQLSELANCSGLVKYIGETSMKFVSGEVPFSNWDQYTARLKELGSEKYTKIHEDVYKRWKRTN